MKYLHEFVSRIDFLKKYFGDDYLQPWASLTTSNYQSDYNRKKRKLSKMPLTTVPLTNDSTTFTFAIGTNVNTDTLESISYSVDGGETGTTTPNVDATAVNIPVTVTNKTPVMGKGVGKAISVSDSVYSRLYANKNFEALGNPLSLIGEQYNLKSLMNNAGALAHLFHNATTLINADKLILSAKKCGERCYHKMFDTCSNLETFPILPAISLADGCYAYMFSACKKMVTPVAVPATKLDQYCYTYMFNGCTGLTSIPELPATNLYQYCYLRMFQDCTGLVDCEINLPAVTMAAYCYQYMFRGCTNLTTVPELPATSLAPYCYSRMFDTCRSLTSIPDLPVMQLENYCYDYMFNGCTGLTDLSEVTLPATTMKAYCYQGMFYGCTNLITPPTISGTTLANYCYQYMFRGCTSLTTTPELPGTNLAQFCYYGMFGGCTSLTTPPILPATSMTGANCYGAMFYQCTGLTSMPNLPATTLTTQCYYQMFQGCTSLSNIVDILPATTLGQRCYENMFYGCTSMTTAPKLPATTLVANCYKNMLYGCTNLNNITALFTTTPNSVTTCNATGVQGVSSTGTFTMSGNAEGDPESYRGVNGVPEGGTVQTYVNPTVDVTFMGAHLENSGSMIEGIPTTITVAPDTGYIFEDASVNIIMNNINVTSQCTITITSNLITITTPNVTGNITIDGTGAIIET